VGNGEERRGGGGRTGCTTSRGRRAGRSVRERGSMWRGAGERWWLVGPREKTAAVVNGTCGFVTSELDGPFQPLVSFNTDPLLSQLKLLYELDDPACVTLKRATESAATTHGSQLT
jgi:hypothetical protein